MTLPRTVRALTASLLLVALNAAAQTAPAACPFKSADLAKHFGVGFEAGKEESGMGGTSCMYVTQGGSIAKGTDFRFWVFVLAPGGSQDMMRTMIAGGPNAKFEAIAGDPDGASRVRAADAGIVDIVYKRSGYVVFLRTSGQGRENADAMAGRLLKLPRLP